MKRLYIAGFVLVIALVLVIWFFYRQTIDVVPQTTTKATPEVATTSVVRFPNVTIAVDIADTEAEREQGLSGRTNLADGAGLLFIFEQADKYGFWMKDMLFPIDIIWFDQNMKIVTIEANLSPQTYPKIFNPKSKSLYVLEVPAGWSASHNLTIGTSAIFEKKP